MKLHSPWAGLPTPSGKITQPSGNFFTIRFKITHPLGNFNKRVYFSWILPWNSRN